MIRIKRATLLDKQALAERLIPLKPIEEVTKEEFSEWKRKQELLSEIKYQIEICEQLGIPLSMEMVELLCTFDNEIQVENFCRPLKLA